MCSLTYHLHIYIHYSSKYHVEKYVFKKHLHNSGEEKNWDKTNYMSDFDICSFLKRNINYVHYTFRNDKIIIISAKSCKMTCLEIIDILRFSFFPFLLLFFFWQSMNRLENLCVQISVLTKISLISEEKVDYLIEVRTIH